MSVDRRLALHWRTSQFCDSSACVQVAPASDEIALRDSKNPDGPILRFSRDEWTAFVAGARAGDFDFE